jgi:hypothetical protein
MDASFAASSSRVAVSASPTLLPSAFGFTTRLSPSFAITAATSGSVAAANAQPGTTGTPRVATASFVRVLSIVTRLLVASQPA